MRLLLEEGKPHRLSTWNQTRPPSDQSQRNYIREGYSQKWTYSVYHPTFLDSKSSFPPTNGMSTNSDQLFVHRQYGVSDLYKQ